VAGEQLALLLVPISFGLLVLAFLIRRDRLRIYELMFAIADAYGLRLGRSRSGAQGEPEARGTIGERPALAYFYAGGKYTPSRIHLLVGHRFPLARSVLFFPSAADSRGYGSRKWARHPLTADPDGPLVMGQDGAALDALVEALTPEGEAFLAGWTQEPDFRVGSIDGRKIELSFLPGKPPVQNAVPLMAELAGIAGFLEEVVEVRGVDYQPLGSGRGGPAINAVLVLVALLLIVVGIFASGAGPGFGLFAVLTGLALFLLFTTSSAERKLMANSREKRAG
jgi:hypothetical protein